MLDRKRGKTQVSDGAVDVTLSDVLYFFVFILTITKFVFGLAEQVHGISDLPLPMTQVGNGNIWKGTMLCCDTMCNEDDSDIHTSSKLALHVPIVIGLCAANAVFSVRKILLSNDVEVNPGPDQEDKQCEQCVQHPTDSEKKDPQVTVGREKGGIPPDAVTEIVKAIQKQTEQMQELQEEMRKQREEMKEEMKQQREEQAAQSKAIREELSDIKQNLGNVSVKCEEINQRCNKLERENTTLADQMADISTDICVVRSEAEESSGECARVATVVDELKEEVSRMTEEIDRLEEFSRRDNLRMFGVAPLNPNQAEDYDACVRAVCSTLNRADGEREWSQQDIVRAHRAGQARPGDPKTMIVKFQHWRDKITLITNRDLRGKL